MLHNNAIADTRVPARRVENGRDLTLMREVARGDRRAQRRLAERLLPELRRVVSKIVRGPDLDDAVQVSLIEVLRSAPNYRGEGGIEAWAQRVAVRRAIRYWKREQKRHAEVRSGFAPDRLAEAEGDRSFTESLPQPIEHYLEQLSEVMRMAIVLRHGFGYSVSDIGDMTESDPNTVKARLFHGRKRLRALVEEDIARGGPNP